MADGVVFGVGREVANSLQLEARTSLSRSDGWFDDRPSVYLKRIGIEVWLEITALKGVFRTEKCIEEPNFR